MENKLDRFDKSEKEVIPLNTDLITEELKKYDIQIVFGNSNDKKKMEIPKDKLTGLTPILNTIPGLLSNYAVSQSYSGAYKIVFQNGLKAGDQLMQMGNSLKTTAIVNAQGKITGQAGLTELSSAASIGPQIAYAAFSLASVVTGQYFLAQINSNLKNISKDIKDIMAFLEISQSSELQSRIEFLREVDLDLRSYPGMLENNELRISYLLKIQNAREDLRRLCNFYGDNLIDIKLNKEKLDQEDLSQIKNYLFLYPIALHGYMLATFFELVFSQNYKVAGMRWNEMDSCKKNYYQNLENWENKIIELVQKSPDFLPDKKKYAGKVLADIAVSSIPVIGFFGKKGILARCDEYKTEKKDLQEKHRREIEKDFIKQKQALNFDKVMQQTKQIDKIYSMPVELIVERDSVSLLIPD